MSAATGGASAPSDAGGAPAPAGAGAAAPISGDPSRRRAKWYHSALLIFCAGLVHLLAHAAVFALKLALAGISVLEKRSAGAGEEVSPVVRRARERCTAWLAARENLVKASRCVLRLATVDALPEDNLIRREVAERYARTEGKPIFEPLHACPKKVSVFFAHPRPFTPSRTEAPIGLFAVSPPEVRPPLLFQFANMYLEALVAGAAPGAVDGIRQQLARLREKRAEEEPLTPSTVASPTGAGGEAAEGGEAVDSAAGAGGAGSADGASAASAASAGSGGLAASNDFSDVNLIIELLDVRGGGNRHEETHPGAGWTVAKAGGVLIRARHVYMAGLSDSAKYLAGKNELSVDQEAVKAALRDSAVTAVFYPTFWYEAPSAMKALMDTCASTQFFRMNFQDDVMLAVVQTIARVLPPEFVLRYATHGLLRDRSAFIFRVSGSCAFGGPRAHAIELLLAFCGMYVQPPVEASATCSPTFHRPSGMPYYSRLAADGGKRAAAIVGKVAPLPAGTGVAGAPPAVPLAAS